MLASGISKDLYRRIFETTLALYRVTDFFPAGEILKRQLREKANEFFGGAVEYDLSREGEEEAQALAAKIRVIQGYLRLSRSMRFVKEINLLVLEREYAFLRDFFERREEALKEDKKEKEGPPAETVKSTNPRKERVNKDKTLINPVNKTKNIGQYGFNRVLSAGSNDRQRVIIEHLKQKNSAKISDFFSIFADISSKTIQRDLQDLVSKNVLRKEGEKRWTVYTLASVL